MKKSFFQKIRILLFLVLVGLSNLTYSQAPPQIKYKAGNLNFGTFYINSAGTITMDPITNSKTESVGIFPLNSLPPTFVTYELIANKNFSYVINATNPVKLLGTGSLNNGNVLDLTLIFDKASYQTTDNKIGVPVIMGGILSVDMNDNPGPYTGTISITVSYQ